MRRVADLDWAVWQPNVRATLLFVVRGAEVLLIRKKRGLGAGKINGPGGKIDPGETAVEAACREVEEEVGVRVESPRAAGTLSFQFVDGLAMHVEVFVWHVPSGADVQPIETDEAVPLWYPLDALPFDEMWADDRLWLSRALSGEAVCLRAVFDGDEMLDAVLSETTAA
ncbi:MAG: 8-oxo-dGTP diphosphatase [Bradymonadia bacterium]